MGVREVKAYLEERGERGRRGRGERGKGEERERRMRVSPALSVSWRTAGVYCRIIFCLLRGGTGEWVWLKRECPPSGT